MNKSVVLGKAQIEQIKQLVEDTRRIFGVYADVPIANDMLVLLERQGIILCEYPFSASEESHIDATITWFETEGDVLTFIGLNTSLCFAGQILH